MSRRRPQQDSSDSEQEVDTGYESLGWGVGKSAFYGNAKEEAAGEGVLTEAVQLKNARLQIIEDDVNDYIASDDEGSGMPSARQQFSDEKVALDLLLSRLSAETDAAKAVIGVPPAVTEDARKLQKCQKVLAKNALKESLTLHGNADHADYLGKHLAKPIEVFLRFQLQLAFWASALSACVQCFGADNELVEEVAVLIKAYKKYTKIRSELESVTPHVLPFKKLASADDKRALSKAIASNRGLVRVRKATANHARVANKEKYRQKLKKLTGVIRKADPQKGSGSYHGESTGITTHVNRSRKIK